MNDQDLNLVRIHRRKALTLVGVTAAGSLLALACGNNAATPPTPTTPTPPPTPPPATPTTPTATATPAATGELDCKDKGPIDDASKTMRRALQYKEKTDTPEKKCSGCVQYVAAAAGAECGGCKLFTGPVNPNGVCLSWVPIKPA